MRSRLGKISLLTEIHKHGTWTFFYTFKKFENTQSDVHVSDLFAAAQLSFFCCFVVVVVFSLILIFTFKS